MVVCCVAWFVVRWLLVLWFGWFGVGFWFWLDCWWLCWLLFGFGCFLFGFVYGVCFDCGCYLGLVDLLLGLFGFVIDCLVRLLV